MENKEFDRLLREKFEKESLRLPASGWTELSPKLSTAVKKKPLSFLKIAAALLFLLGLSAGLAFLWNNRTSSLDSSKSLALNPREKVSESSGSKPQNQLAALSATGEGRVVSGNRKQVARHSDVGQEQHLQNKAGRDLAILRQTASSSLPVTKQETSIVEKGKITAADKPAGSQSGVVDSQGDLVAASSQKEKAEEYRKSFSSSVLLPQEQEGLSRSTGDEMLPFDNKGRETSLALGGGMNYGALNAGYSIGLSARRSLGKHLFIEGAIAFLYNSDAPNTTNYPGPPTTPSRPSSYNPSKAKSPSMGLISDFYFLQVNPSLGYQVNKLLAFSVGADLQQRIASMSQNGTAVFTPGSNPRIIPQLDLGFTGKTEFFISPKIEAGLLFRNGLNNFFDSQTTHPYLNRRYFQLQLKYNFLLK